MEKKLYQNPHVKILALSGRKLMDDWEIGGTVVDVQGAKRHFEFEDEDEGTTKKRYHNVWDY
ncbi:MAG: hypothetical protein IKX24_09675 [Prevotella sp.]|nr:hypothetical protein [Prevotella sp.]MBR5062391.1 hypothetical protein [Prevotella sp.]